MATSASRSLWPREHGAYVQLGAPLLAALALRLPTLPAISLAVAACLAFVANEPLLVVLGHRGARIRATYGRRAAHRLAIAAIGAAAFATAGLVAGPQPTRAIAGLAAVPAACMVALAWMRREHSVAGELVAAVVLPGAAAPIAVASGLGWHEATAIWCAWSVGYSCSVAAVHRVLVRHRHAASSLDRVLVIVLTAIAVGGVVLAPSLPIALVTVPLAAISAAVVLRPPRATHLRAIGVALVIASVASGTVVLVVG